MDPNLLLFEYKFTRFKSAKDYNTAPDKFFFMFLKHLVVWLALQYFERLVYFAIWNEKLN